MIIKPNASASLISKKAMYYLKKRHGFYLCRCGDGENILLNLNNADFLNFFNVRHCKSQIGYMLEGERLNMVIENLKISIEMADVLGIALPKQIKVNPYLKNQHETLSGILENNSKQNSETMFSPMFVNHALLESGLLDSIIKSASKVVLITCRDIREKFMAKYSHIEYLEVHIIPEEHQFRTKRRTEKYFPTAYGRVIKAIKNQNRQGQLCLFGAGWVGKRFGAEFKKRGGVALDIGSVFDMWDGKLTRGVGKGKTATDMKYAL